MLAWLLVSSALASEWQDLFQRDLDKCESFPADAYETGLLFNPAGRRTYCERSRWQPLSSDGHSLVKTIDQQQIYEALPNQSIDREVRIRISLELPPRSHSDQFVLALLPIESKLSTFDKDVDFSKL